MHTFQTIAETYGVDWGGVYPTTVAEMQSEASGNANAYWKDFANPFINTSGAGNSYDDAVATVAKGAKITATVKAGIVAWNPLTVSGATSQYWVYGGDKSGFPIVDKGVILTLSNS